MTGDIRTDLPVLIAALLWRSNFLLLRYFFGPGRSYETTKIDEYWLARLHLIPHLAAKGFPLNGALRMAAPGYAGRNWVARSNFRLRACDVQRITASGTHADGNGLYLRVRSQRCQVVGFRKRKRRSAQENGIRCNSLRFANISPDVSTEC
jgi:hypothetical protein